MPRPLPSRRTWLAASAVAASALSLSVTGLASASAHPTHPASADSPASWQSLVQLHPGATHAAPASSIPLSTHQCESKFKIACYSALQVQKAYSLPALYKTGVEGQGQTIVIVDAFGSPTIRRDLARFDTTYHLPAPPVLDAIQPAGKVPAYKPTSEREGWAGETTLDVEYAHAMAPKAKILIVETPVSENEGTSGFPQIETAEKYVIAHHLGVVISQSFSATEQTFPTAESLHKLRGAYVAARKAGVTVLAASGDSGAADAQPNGSDLYTHAVTSWPDSDPLVTGVGGTRLHLNAAGQHTEADTVWNDTYNVPTQRYIFGNNGPNPLAGGGGKSVIFGRPTYQYSVRGVTGDHRGVPDISMSGACNGAVNVYQSFPGQTPGWYPTCGTSEATPLFAGIVALAAQKAGHGLGLINPALYSLSAKHASGIKDVTRGNNKVTFTQKGKTYTIPGYSARTGYDLASGVGTVDALYFVPQLAGAAG